MKRFGSLVDVFRKRWVRRTALILAAVFILFGLFGYLVLPGIIKTQAEKAVTAALHRRFTIERVDVRPYSLAVSVEGVKLYEPDGQTVFVSFQDLQARVSASSLVHLAPVVKEVHLVGPFVHLTRTAPNRYSTDDIVAALAASKGAEGRSPAEAQSAKAGARFSVYNIRIDGGRFEFDDRPAGAHHTVADFTLGIPFISSLPSQEEVFVEPLLSAVINGSPLVIKGRARPFAPTREAIVDLDLDQVDLTRYLAYLPFEPRFRMPTAQLEVHLQASFQQPVDRAPAVVVSGKVALKSLQLTGLGGDPILNLPQLSVELGKTDVFSGHINLSRMALTGLDLNVVKDARGQLNLALLAPAAPAPKATTSAAAPTATNAPSTNATTAATTTAAANGAAPASAGPAMTVAIGEIALQDVALRFSDRSAARPLEAGVEQFNLRIAESTLDLKAQQLAIGRIESDSARFRVQQGRTEPQPAAAADQAAAAPVPTAAGHAAPAPVASQGSKPWTMSVGRVSIGNWAARIESKGLPQLAVTAVTAISMAAEGVSNASGSAPGKIELKATVNRSGAISVAGALGLQPVHADLALALKSVDLLALQPYFTERVNLLVTQADLSTHGRFALDVAADGSIKGGFRGDATLGNVATIDKLDASDFVNWKALSFSGVDAKLAPFSLAIDQIKLSEFFARVIIDPSGRINLQDIVRSGGEQRSLTSEQPQAAAPTLTPGPSPTGVGEGSPSSSAGAAPAALPIKIREIRLEAGRVRYTDNFIKPNYTANLVELTGTVSGLSSQADSTADVQVTGQVNNAPLNIAGQVNPIKGDLFMDLKAGVHGMELAPLSPYSGKYVGYGIERGKLSFDVAYHLEHRQLKAENRLVLDQLTFGDKVESPTATKLPVQLAIALLKDRNGVIDLNVPIGGSLDDPQFSVGGVILKVIVNLITKAVTAPFALLGSLFGGGEELSFIEYAPGSVDPASTAEVRLKSLAKALNERPGLKLEIAAWVDPESDRDGLRRQSLDRRVRALKVKDLVVKGQSATVSDVTVSPEEYPALLGRLYEVEKREAEKREAGKRAADKSGKASAASNAQTPAPVDIEKLLLANTSVGDDELAALGDRRSQSVKQWLQTTGQVPEARLFLLATRVGTATGAGQADQTVARPDQAVARPDQAAARPDQGAARPDQTAAKSSRVEFTLK
jgi:hypothetical protein